jgi:hypothetical protein
MPNTSQQSCVLGEHAGMWCPDFNFSHPAVPLLTSTTIPSMWRPIGASAGHTVRHCLELGAAWSHFAMNLVSDPMVNTSQQTLRMRRSVRNRYQISISVIRLCHFLPGQPPNVSCEAHWALGPALHKPSRTCCMERFCNGFGISITESQHIAMISVNVPECSEIGANFQ